VGNRIIVIVEATAVAWAWATQGGFCAFLKNAKQAGL